MTLGLRWLVDNARLRREKSMAERLANEMIDASNGLGAAVKKRKTPTRWQKLIRLLHTIGGN